ncbi:hypothetical protein [Aurantiacibacter sp. MUD61]|uniref:hypothetical protein n=1 Tax=Aurantiacibacter sp. MUD61 TaxID=3009083 RepID=UPI0022F134A2|nr:hypothetical protein [Aurantiacibacter sp. MUD61]
MIVVIAASGSSQAVEVQFLQRLRRELRKSGPAGAGFIRAVNGLYYSVSPKLVWQMRKYPGLKWAIRDVLVKPSVGIIDRTRKISGFKPDGTNGAIFAAMLASLGIAGMLASPILLCLVMMRWAVFALSSEQEVGDGR